MEKLKNPKVWGPVLAGIVTVALAMFADIRPVAEEICRSVLVEPVVGNQE